MKIISVKDIVRKDVPIYYRLLYTGVVVIELTGSPQDYRVDFSIEIKPTGQKEIIVTFLDPPDYPLLPIIKDLKSMLDSMHSNGQLPD